MDATKALHCLGQFPKPITTGNAFQTLTLACRQNLYGIARLSNRVSDSLPCPRHPPVKVKKTWPSTPNLGFGLQFGASRLRVRSIALWLATNTWQRTGVQPPHPSTKCLCKPTAERSCITKTDTNDILNYMRLVKSYAPAFVKAHVCRTARGPSATAKSAMAIMASNFSVTNPNLYLGKTWAITALPTCNHLSYLICHTSLHHLLARSGPPTAQNPASSS